MNSGNDFAPSIIPPKAMLFDLDNTLTHRGLSIERYAQRFLAHFHDALHATSLTQLATAGMRAIWLRGFHPWPLGWEPATCAADALQEVSNLLP